MGQLAAQDNRPTEVEINTQKDFIEANKEKLLGNYEVAARLYKEVLKKDKDNHAAAYELARLYEVLDIDDKAMQSIQMAVALDSKNEWYQMFLADMHQKMDQFSEASDIYKDLISKFPNNDYYYTKQAYYLVKAKQPEKGIKVYDQMEKKFGIAEDIVTKKYRLYLGLGQKKKAQAELEKLVNAYPFSIKARHQLADFYKQNNKKADANKVYKEILEMNPDDAKANMALAGEMKSGGDDTAYLNSLNAIFSNPDVDIDAKVKELFPYIKQLETSNDQALKDKVMELGQLLTETHSKDPKSFSVYGDLLYHTGDVAGARTQYEKTIDLDNNVFSVWEQLMYIYAEQNEIDKLESFSEKAMDVFPNKAKVYYFNGIANSEKDKHANAAASFEQARMMSGKNKALKYDVLSRLGLAYSQMKKSDRADKIFKEALELNPDQQSYFFQYAYACSFYNKAEFETSKDWLDKALGNGGADHPDVLERFGDVMFKMENVENAIKYWEKAKAKGSNSDKLEKKITDRKLYE